MAAITSTKLIGPYDVIPYNKAITRVSVSCYSSCGPIQVKGFVGLSKESIEASFRPDSPVYQVLNTSAAGNVLFPLSGTINVSDLLVVTFLNNGGGGGNVQLCIVLNSDLLNQNTIYDTLEVALDPGKSKSYTCKFAFQS